MNFISNDHIDQIVAIYIRSIADNCPRLRTLTLHLEHLKIERTGYQARGGLHRETDTNGATALALASLKIRDAISIVLPPKFEPGEWKALCEAISPEEEGWTSAVFDTGRSPVNFTAWLTGVQFQRGPVEQMRHPYEIMSVKPSLSFDRTLILQYQIPGGRFRNRGV